MRERFTARVLLLDPNDRILLMNGRLPGDPDAPQVWFTIGGGVEPGETLLERQPLHFKERFVVARTIGGAPSRRGWQPQEHEFIDDMRWWSLGELTLTGETVFPEGLADLLPDVLAGRFPTKPLVIRTLDGPVTPIPRPG